MGAGAPVDPGIVGVVTGLRRFALVVIAGGALVVGVWAQLFPRSFYDDFPGAGRVWVAVDGPYNEHLVRDVGGLQLALALVAIVALVTGSVLVARLAGGAALVFGVPHLVYHSMHLDAFETGDKLAMLGSLGFAALAAAVALLPATAGSRAAGGGAGAEAPAGAPASG